MRFRALIFFSFVVGSLAQFRNVDESTSSSASSSSSSQAPSSSTPVTPSTTSTSSSTTSISTTEGGTCPPPPSNLKITTDENGCMIFEAICPTTVCPQPPVVPEGCTLVTSQNSDINNCTEFMVLCPPEGNGQSEPVQPTPACEFGLCDVNEVCIEEPRECPANETDCIQFRCEENAIGLGFLDKMFVPFGVTINKIPLGGNVGLAYDKIRDLFFVLQMAYKFQGVSVKTLRMKIDETGYCTLEFNLPLTLLSDFNGNPFFNETQPSSLVYFQDHLFWSTQGEEGVGAPHAIRRMGFDGMEQERLQNPPSHALQFENDTQVAGVRSGNGYSGLSIWENRLMAILQGPLVQDPPLTNDSIAYVRVVEYKLDNITRPMENTTTTTSTATTTASSTTPSNASMSSTAAPSNLPVLPSGVPGNFTTLLDEYLLPLGPRPRGYDKHGVADIAHIDRDRIVLLETASNSVTGKFRSWLFLMRIREFAINPDTNEEELVFQATPVTGIPSIRERMGDVSAEGPIIPAKKIFIREISERTLDLRKNLDFLQSMSLGPRLADGTPLLITDTNDEFEAKPRQIQSYVWSFRQRNMTSMSSTESSTTTTSTTTTTTIP